MATAAVCTSTIQVLALCGSLRAASTNMGLIRAAMNVAPASMQITVAEIGSLPLFNQDLEADGVEGLPDSVKALRAAISGADAVLVASPENNFGIAAPLKNALDWGSRAGNLWDGLPLAIMGAGGGTGTARASDALRAIVPMLGMNVMNHQLGVRLFEKPGPVDWETGDVTDDATIQRIAKLLTKFEEHIVVHRAGQAALKARQEEMAKEAGGADGSG